MCISTAQARIKCAAEFCLFRTYRFARALCLFFELCSFHPGHFEVLNVIWRGRCRTSVWQV